MENEAIGIVSLADAFRMAEEADVDQYVNELRKTLMAEIAAGKKVIV